MNSKPPTNPWVDLTEPATLPFRDEETGERKNRVFILREMTREDCDKLTDLYYKGLEKLQTEATGLEIEGMPTVDLVKRSFALQWETQDEAIQFMLRHPEDGGQPPSLERIRLDLNERRFTMLVEAQDRLNGTAAAKKKAEDLARAMALDAARKKAGLSSMIESRPDTVDSQTISPDDTATEKPSS